MASTYEYRIGLAPLANDDLFDIAEYITNELQSPQSAEVQLRRIKAAIMTLGDYPYRVPLIRESLLARRGYRALVVDNYMVFYLIQEPDKEVNIMRVLYAKRDYKNHL